MRSEKDQQRYLTPESTAKLVHRSAGTLANDRWSGRGLPYIKVGGRILYDLKDIEKFMERHKIRP